MSESALSITESSPETGRERLPGESAAWFNRYCLYRDLGHKRSLRAAVAKERENVRVLSETPTATKSHKNEKSEECGSVHLQVPGSWKAAAKTYRWGERARAFDAWLIGRSTDLTQKMLASSYANKYKRVIILDSLVKNALEILNTNLAAKSMSLTEYQLMVKRIQSLLTQLGNEMHGIDDATMRAAIEAHQRTLLDEIETAYQQGKKRVEVRAY